MATLSDFNLSIPPDATGEVYSTCPKCSHTRKKQHAKCLSINVEKGAWICHHCGWRGTTDKGEVEGSRPYAWKKDFYQPSATQIAPLSQKAKSFFSNRKIPDHVLTRNKIGQWQCWMPQLEEFVNALAFPYFQDGRLINVKSRDHKKNFRFVTGAQLIPYGIDDVKDAESVIWVEGEIDKLSVEVAGFKNCLSVPNGASGKKLDWLDSFMDLLGSKSHVIAVDMDHPGQSLAEELSRRFGKEICSRVQWPEGCKDANEVLVAHGAEAITQAIQAAQPYPISGIHRVTDFSEAVDSLWVEGLPPGADPGWEELSRYYTVSKGQLTVTTGMPGSGKSEWVDALCCNLALRYGWRIGVFSPENYPQQLHISKLCEKYIRKPFGHGPNERMNRYELDEAKDWVNDHFFWILPDDGERTLDDILTKARAAIRRYGIDALIIDPWNEVEHSMKEGENETMYVSRALSEIRWFARTHGVHVWLVAHPTKLRKDDHGKYPPPTMYDISGSAHFRNKADMGITVHRDQEKDTQEVEIYVTKVRFKHTGKLGKVTLRYDKVTGTYFEARF